MSNNTRLAELMNYITIDTTSGNQLQMSGSIKQTSITSSLLKASSTGVLVSAVAGTDYLTSVNISNLTATGTPSSTTYLRGDNTWATIAGGGSGTVTSVGLSMPSAFTVSNSPVTTSGTLTVVGAGNTTQYIAGDGSLITFPTLLSADKMMTVGRNATGATLFKGTVVYISGSTGNRPNFVKAQANAESTSAGTFGVVYADIANNSDGNVVTIGVIDTLDTRSTATNPFTDVTLVDGDTIYLHPTIAGYVTNVKPSAPNHLVYVGKVVRTSPTVGTIVYRIQNGYELDEIHDVQVGSYVNKDILYRDTATNLWKNASVATVLGYTPYNATNPSSYIALTGLSSTATGLTYTNTTGVFSLTSGYAIPTTTSQTNWDTAYTNRITSLTTTGSSGAATLITNVLNIPTYTLVGLGGQANSTNLTSLSGLTYVSASFVKMTAANTFALDTSTYLTANQSITLSGAVTGSGTTAITTTLANSVVGISNLSATGTPSSTTYLRGDNTWAAVSGGGGGTVTSVAALTLGTTGTDLTSTVATGTTTPVITLNVPNASAANRGALTSTDWSTFNSKQGTITLTTTGSSGASTFTTNTLNIPNYTLAGLGGQASSTNLTSLSGLSFVSTSFVKMTAAGTFALDTTTYYAASNPSGYTNNTGTVTSVAALTLGTTGTDLSSSVATGTTTAVITLNVPTASAANRGALSAADWATFNSKQATITLTTTGSSGAATFTTNTLNIPNYTLAGLGGQASSTNLTSLSGLTFASTSFVKMTAAGTFALDTTAYGTGSVTSVSVTTANGVSGSVATSTTTPAITLTLGAITPTTVNGLTLAAAVTGFTIAGGSTTSKTLTISNTLTLAGTDTSTLNIGTGGTLGSAAFTASTAYQASNTNLSSLAGLSFVSTSFVKMTAAGTFALDTNTYYLSSNPSGYTNNTGTVTSVSVTTANGVSGTVATSTTTPAITLSLGAITPSTVNGLTFTAAATGFTIAGGTTSKTLTVSNTLTFSGTDTSTLNIGGGGTLGSAAFTASTAYQASNTNLTSVAGLSFVSTSFVKMTAAGTFALDTNTYYLSSNPSGYTANLGTVTSVAALTLGTTGTDLSSSVATNTTTPVITLNVPTASATNRGALSSADWSTFNGKQAAISLTTTGSSGAATFATNTLNIPNYTLAGLGGQASSTNLTSLSGLSFVSTSFVKMTAAGTFALDTNTYYLSSNPSGYTNNTGTVTGTGTANSVVKFTSTTAIGNGIATDNGTTFAISGALTATGDITAFSSDIRLKENIVNIPNALDKILSLNGVTYDWNNKALAFGFVSEKRKHDVGLIAQQVEAVLPEAIAPAPFDTDVDSGNSISGDNYLTIRYDKMVALLIEGMKEQQAQIEELKLKLNSKND